MSQAPAIAGKVPAVDARRDQLTKMVWTLLPHTLAVTSGVSQTGHASQAVRLAEETVNEFILRVGQLTDSFDPASESVSQADLDAVLFSLEG